MRAREKQQWQAMLAQSFEPRDWFINDDAPEEPYRVVYQYRLINGRYSVGYYCLDGRWVERRWYKSIDEAVATTHRLNRDERSA